MIGDIAGGILLALFILYVALPLAVALLIYSIRGFFGLLTGIGLAYDSFMRGAGRVCGFFLRLVRGKSMAQ